MIFNTDLFSFTLLLPDAPRRNGAGARARASSLLVTFRRAYYALHEREKWPRFADR
jgi:hypothetical protein